MDPVKTITQPLLIQRAQEILNPFPEHSAGKQELKADKTEERSRKMRKESALRSQFGINPPLHTLAYWGAETDAL